MVIFSLYTKGRKKKQRSFTSWLISTQEVFSFKKYSTRSQDANHTKIALLLFLFLFCMSWTLGLRTNRRQHRLHLELSLFSQHWKQQQKFKWSHGTKRPWETLWQVNIWVNNISLSKCWGRGLKNLSLQSILGL